MSLTRLPVRQIAPSGADDGQGMVWSDSLNMWVPATVVQSIVAGTGVTVDDTDPANPVLSATGGGGGGGTGLYPGGFFAGSYYTNPFATGSNTSSLTAGALECHPFPVPGACTIDQLLAVVSASNASGRLRLGIYDSGSDGMPHNLVIDAGQVTSGSTGNRTVSISQALSAGNYWLAALADVVGGTWTAWGSTPTAAILGYSSAGSGPYTRLSISGVTVGALPSTAPAMNFAASGTGGLRLFARAA